MYPCPRPGGCPTNSLNHIRRGTCSGCNYDLLAHTNARKQTKEAVKKESMPSLPVVLRAARREVEKLGQLGCSASLMIPTPVAGKQSTRWVYASVGVKGNAFTERFRGYFRKAMKDEGLDEVKAEPVANSNQKANDSKENGSAERMGPSLAAGFVLSPSLEKLVKGFADRYPEEVVEMMLTALKKHCIDEDVAKQLDMDALQGIFGKDKLGPCLRFKSSVQSL